MSEIIGPGQDDGYLNLLKTKKPTLKELEAILNSEEDIPVKIQPNGEILKDESGPIKTKDCKTCTRPFLEAVQFFDGDCEFCFRKKVKPMTTPQEGKMEEKVCPVCGGYCDEDDGTCGSSFHKPPQESPAPAERPYKCRQQYVAMFFLQDEASDSWVVQSPDGSQEFGHSEKSAKGKVKELNAAYAAGLAAKPAQVDKLKELRKQILSASDGFANGEPCLSRNEVLSMIESLAPSPTVEPGEKDFAPEEALAEAQKKFGLGAHISMHCRHEKPVYSIWRDFPEDYEKAHPKSERLGYGASFREAFAKADSAKEGK